MMITKGGCSKPPQEHPKPPLGATPYKITALVRIQELIKALNSHQSDVLDNLSRVRQWAKEIELQCDLIETMNIDSINKKE